MIARLALLAMLVVVGRYAFLQRRKLPVHLLLVASMLAAAAALVLFPDASTELANLVGIGRGVDLVGYLVDVLLLFVALHYYTKFIDLDVRLTQIARAVALSERDRQSR